VLFYSDFDLKILVMTAGKRLISWNWFSIIYICIHICIQNSFKRRWNRWGMATLFYQFLASSSNRYFYTEMAISFFPKTL